MANLTYIKNFEITKETEKAYFVTIQMREEFTVRDEKRMEWKSPEIKTWIPKSRSQKVYGFLAVETWLVVKIAKENNDFIKGASEQEVQEAKDKAIGSALDMLSEIENDMVEGTYNPREKKYSCFGLVSVALLRNYGTSALAILKAEFANEEDEDFKALVALIEELEVRAKQALLVA